MAGLTLRTTSSSGQQAATILWPILMIPPSGRTKRKLDHDLYQNLLRGTFWLFTTIQSPNEHRFQEDDFTHLVHDTTLDLHKVSKHPYKEASS